MKDLKHIKLFENFSDDNTIELTNGYEIVGPATNAQKAEEIVKRINDEMDSVYQEFIEQGESRAMDERDDVVYKYQDELSAIGYSIKD